MPRSYSKHEEAHAGMCRCMVPARVNERVAVSTLDHSVDQLDRATYGHRDDRVAALTRVRCLCLRRHTWEAALAC
jgi:hypothetical protein